ncbi:hypothetical protein [Nonomuraea lactucae]|uniref:hypothetical protein n=1 Tax=Nonomuraea lactucae TaxID=2249762 RepID=UPI000DE23EEF|nr:hypothetical protein [Nonomuraea lactucae]
MVIVGLLMVPIVIAGLVIMNSRRRRRAVILPRRPLSAQELEDHVRDLTGQGEMIAAVKLVRQQTGLDLIQAKAMVDGIAAGGSALGHPAMRRLATPRTVDRADLATRVRDLKAAGRSKQAVHLVRGETGMGRREAELFVSGL